MVGQNALLPDPFLESIDRYHFHVQNITTVRLESPAPLPLRFLQEMQQELGMRTVKFGRFSWTKFPSWQNAFEFYLTYNGYVAQAGKLVATPVDHTGYTFQDLMEFYITKAVQFDIHPRVILRY